MVVLVDLLMLVVMMVVNLSIGVKTKSLSVVRGCWGRSDLSDISISLLPDFVVHRRYFGSCPENSQQFAGARGRAGIGSRIGGALRIRSRIGRALRMRSSPVVHYRMPSNLRPQVVHYCISQVVRYRISERFLRLSTTVRNERERQRYFRVVVLSACVGKSRCF